MQFVWTGIIHSVDPELAPYSVLSLVLWSQTSFVLCCVSHELWAFTIDFRTQMSHVLIVGDKKHQNMYVGTNERCCIFY